MWEGLERKPTENREGDKGTKWTMGSKKEDEELLYERNHSSPFIFQRDI
jgi:hypothetical protein